MLIGITVGQMSSIAAGSGAMHGVHLGNVSDGKGWNEAFFSRLRGVPQSAIRNPQSAIRNPQSAIRIPHSAFRIPHSAIGSENDERER